MEIQMAFSGTDLKRNVEGRNKGKRKGMAMGMTIMLRSCVFME
jgi:hypothetical protein